MAGYIGSRIVNTLTDLDGVAIDGASITNSTIVPTSSFMFRNKVINGGMKLSQRGTSFNFVHDGTTLWDGASSGYTLDRFQFNTSNIGGADQYDGTISQYSMSAAELNITGHSKALKLLTATAESPIENNEQFHFSYKIEAQDVQDLQYGTASAKTTTLSFWVKSSVTGTYAVNLYKADATARMINKTYTINTADTWEKKIISIVGDTDSTGSINDDNGEGLRILWVLASGSDFNSSSSATWTDHANANFLGGHAQNGVITTAGADWYLTGVQLEIGSSATPFEHRPAGMELSLCQRYFQKLEYRSSWGAAGFGLIRPTVSRAMISLTFIQEMRANPHTITLPTIGNGVGNITFLVGDSYPGTHGSLDIAYATKTDVTMHFINFSSLGSQGQVSWAYVSGDPATAIFQIDSEL